MFLLFIRLLRLRLLEEGKELLRLKKEGKLEVVVQSHSSKKVLVEQGKVLVVLLFLVGGGTTFGPKPRSYAQKLNKKVVKTAINAVIADKFQAGKLTVLDKIESNGKTKDLHKDLVKESFASSC